MKSSRRLLLFLALQAGLRGKAFTSTARLARHFGVSQQTASRRLRALKRAGLILLDATPTGCVVQLSDQGVDSLRQEFVSLKQLFESKRPVSLAGFLKPGLGEGRYYVSRPFYLAQFRKLLGFKPFFGTLNLEVDSSELRSFLEGLEPVEVPGFEDEERRFGKITAFRVSFRGLRAALVFPERSVHRENEVEVIAAVNLRKRFKLRDGGKVVLRAV